jgi:hypothetical protein
MVMACQKHSARVVAKLLCMVLMLASPLAAGAQNALPDDAKQVLRQTSLQLELLAERYTRAGQADAAQAIVIELRRIEALLRPNPLSPQPMSSPAPLRVMGYRNRTGETFRVRVTAAATGVRRGIWGTDIYTDDSDLSSAVVHAGLLSAGQDGEVLITFLPGQGQYTGSTRNGISTDAFGSFPGSYRLARFDAASAALPLLPASNVGTATGFALATSVFNVTPLPSPFIATNAGPFFPLDEQNLWQLLGGQAQGTRANFGPNLMALRSRVNESFEFEVTGRTTGTIWGDGVYTDDSDLGVTAVHAGLLAPGERGKVRITILPGLPRYDATMKNNVSSLRYGGWEGSYRVEGGGKTATSSAGGPASISGRITDSATGRPLFNAYVAALRIGFSEGRRSISETISASTNADGEYRLSEVLPGTYGISAVSVSRSSAGNPPPAYFPGVAAPDTALQIPVRANQQVVGVDFAVVSATLFKVTGKVANPPPNGVPSLSVVQRDPSKLTASTATLLTNTSPNRARGEFELMLPAGSWDVFPVTSNTRPGNAGVPPAGVPAYTAGRTSVDVIDRDVDAGSVSVGATDITGRVLIDPAVRLPEGFSLSTMEVRLVAVDGTPAPLWHHARSTKPGPDGRFTLPSVPPGEYALQFSPAIPDAYVSDSGTLRVKPEPLGPVEVVFKAGGGTVQGTVQISSSRSVTSGKVVLVPASSRRGNLSLYKQQSITPSGREFHFSNVPPGQYKIFAFESLPAGGAEMNAEFMSKYEEFGESITVSGSGSLRVPVRWIEAEN